jgi:2-C-methyl-D-erythritol 4-phosphate cytidylyltransferase
MPIPAPPALRCYALVPCAGTGTRAGAPVPKQYVEIDGAPMVAHTLGALAGVARIKLILVALAPGDEEFERRVELPVGKRFAISRCGGDSRAETVAAGLSRLLKQGARADDWVLVHDAARCLVRPEWIDRLIDVCADDPVGGLLAMPVADTLKRESAGRVMTTLPRDAVWQAQTPQMFRLGPLADALEDAGSNATDEASAMEWRGLSPRLVPGSSENFKITQPEDFALAEAVLRARRKEIA